MLISTFQIHLRPDIGGKNVQRIIKEQLQSGFSAVSEQNELLTLDLLNVLLE